MSKTNDAPSHNVYAVVKGKKGSFWNKIGAAWPHGDGEGFNISLDYLPLNGADIVIRKPLPKTGETETAAIETA